MSYDAEILRMKQMIDDLRQMRDRCEPKNQHNPRYHALSMAVSSLNKVIGDMQKENALEQP